MKIMRILALLLLALTLGACASSAPRTQGPSGPSDVYPGNGRGNSLGAAIANAKVDAIRNAVIDLIGPSAEQQHAERLQQLLYGTNNPNQYVYAETMETLRRDNMGTQSNMDMIYEIEIRVRVDSIQRILETNGIGAAARTAQTEGQAGQAQGSTQTPGQNTPQPPEPEEPIWEGASPQQRQFLARYLATMTWMVYFDEASTEDAFLMGAALTQANGYLVEQGYTVIYPDQIEELKKDSQLVAEASTGREGSILQYIAQRLNADVYVTVDASTSRESAGQNHYGQAIITLNAFETSTGQLLASLSYTSPRTLSRVDQFDAVSNAIQSSVYQSMPRLVQQSRTVLERQFEIGIRYELSFQNSQDARLMSQLRQAIRREVSDIQTTSQTADQTSYVVYYFGRVDDLMDMVFDISFRVPGLENLDLVLTRGKSLTFDTGL